MRAWRSAIVAGAAVFLVCAGVTSSVAFGQEPAAAAGVSTAASKVEQGRVIFEARCGMCHQKGGTGTFMLGRRLGAQNALLADRKMKLDATYVKHVVRNGVVSMPRITRAEVSDAELDAIVSYLTRKRKAGAK